MEGGCIVKYFIYLSYNKIMKILHITNGIGVGGIASFIEELLYQLSLDKNNEITLLCLEENKEGYREKKLEKVNVVFLNQKSNFSFKNIFKIRKLIKENDIIHVHLFPAQYVTVLASLFLNKKLIFTEHTTTNKRRKFKIFNLIEKYIIYKKYQKVVCVSKAAENNLKNWLSQEKNIITIQNGIDLEKFRSGKNLRKELKLPENKKIITMVARFSRQKDQLTLIKAMTKLSKEIICIFIGIGETLGELKKIVNEYKLDNQIKFLGYREDINNILKSVDLNILSSHYEGLPLIILETMASGTLILATDIDGNKEILNSELLFEHENDKELAKKIELLLYDEKLIKKQKQFIDQEIKKYDVKNMVKKYKNLYQEVIRAKDEYL